MISKTKSDFRLLEGLRILTTGARRLGLTPIEDIFTHPRIYLVLYKHGLYTIEDLIEYGKKVYLIEDKVPFEKLLLALGITTKDYESILEQYTNKEEITPIKRKLI